MPLDTFANLKIKMPVNTTGLVSSQDMNDLLDTLEQFLKSQSASEGGAIVLHGIPGLSGFGPGAMLKLNMSRWQNGIDFFIETNDGSQQGRVLTVYAFPGSGTPGTYIDKGLAYHSRYSLTVSGTGAATTTLPSMVNLESDLTATDPTLAMKNAVGGSHIMFWNQLNEIRSKIIQDGRIEMLFASQGPILKSADGRRFHAYLDNTPAWVLEDLTPGGLPPASNGGNGNAYLGTLLPDVLAAQAATPIAALWCGGAGVTADGAPSVTSLADLTERAGGIGALAAGPGGGPAWDATNERMTFSGTQLLRTAESQFLRHDKALSIILVTVIPDVVAGQWPCAIADRDDDARIFGCKIEPDTVDQVRALYGTGAFATSSVGPHATNRRLIKIDTNNLSGNASMGIEIFNAARAADNAGVSHATNLNNAFAVGGRPMGVGYCPLPFYHLAAIVHGQPNTAWMNVFKTWINAKTLHAPVYA